MDLRTERRNELDRELSAKGSSTSGLQARRARAVRLRRWWRLPFPVAVLRRAVVRLRKWSVLIVVGAVLVTVIATVAYTYETSPSRNTPSCSWPMRVVGPATKQQEGLVRCYLRALAHRNTSELKSLMVRTHDYVPKLTPADLQYSSDANKGTATVSFPTQNLVDTENVTLVITYADGAVEKTSLQNMLASDAEGPSVWRMGLVIS